MRANGTALREVVFVRVEGGWFAAPVTLVISSLIFVAFTIVQSVRQKQKKYMIWKSSSLSTLLSLSDDLHLQVGGLRTLSEIHSTLQPAKASLVQVSEREWRLQGAPTA